MRYYISPPPMNPVSRFITAIMAVLVLAGAFFFGLAVLVILVGAFSLFALVFYLRMWWLGRAHEGVSAAPKEDAPEGKVIDAEYTVVSRRRN